MEKNRHFSGIGRETGVEGQNIQHFMSNSPWSAEAVYRQVQEDVKATPGLTRGGVLLSYVNLTVAGGFWTWIRGKLFLPEAWFEAGYRKRRQELGIPDSLSFKTKVELAWERIQEVLAGGLAFEIVGFDSLYGRSGWPRAQVRQANQRYLAEVPADTHMGKAHARHPASPG